MGHMRQKTDVESETDSEVRGEGRKWGLGSTTIWQDGTGNSMIQSCFRKHNNNSQEIVWSEMHLLGKYEDLKSIPKINVKKSIHAYNPSRGKQIPGALQVASLAEF